MVQGNDLMRILNVAAFAVSGYASTEGRHCKPFNPLLGETYEADYPDKGLRFFSEKVMHIGMSSNTLLNSFLSIKYEKTVKDKSSLFVASCCSDSLSLKHHR